MGTNDSRIGSSQTRTKKMGRIVRNDLLRTGYPIKISHHIASIGFGTPAFIRI